MPLALLATNNVFGHVVAVYDFAGLTSVDEIAIASNVGKQ